MTTALQPMSKQDLLIRMSIDPRYSPEIEGGLYQQMVGVIGDDRLLQVNIKALHAERRGRWLQLLGQIKPIFKKTFVHLGVSEDFVFSSLFQAFLSSEFLWQPEYSLPHPKGYGRGIEKATPFLHFLRAQAELPQEWMELAELEYAIFKGAYHLPNKQSEGNADQYFTAPAATFLSAQHDVLAVLEGKTEQAPQGKLFYIVTPVGRTFRVTEEVFQFLQSFQDGRSVSAGNEWEQQVLKTGLSLRVLCENPQEFDDLLAKRS